MAKRRASAFPPWLRRPLPAGGTAGRVKRLLSDLDLHTVCQGALCPNQGLCFSEGTATFLILGDRCTRNCAFCAIPEHPAAPPDPEEPARVAEAARRLGLNHVVVTSVTRDDLADGGAGHFAETIKLLNALPGVDVEVLVPDFSGSETALRHVVDAGPCVFNHNLETVPGLYYRVRPQADYRTSLDVLRGAKRARPAMFTKSGLMLGLGEDLDEVRQVLTELRAVSCDLVTLGQYLAPSERHLPVHRFVHPDEFEALRVDALAMGFRGVASAPLVRSSYRAHRLVQEGNINSGEQA